MMTNLPIKLIALCFILTFLGCAAGSKKEISIVFDKEYALKPKVYDTELFITFSRIAVVDTFLIIVTTQQDSFCKVYSIPSGMKEVYSYGYIGNGPNEFLQPLLTYSYNNTFGLNEVNKQELAIMRLDSKNGSLSITEEKRLKAPYKMKKGELNPPDYKFTKLDDTHYVSFLGGGENLYFSLLDSTLTHITRFGELPIPEEVSVLTIRNRLQGHIAASNGTMVFGTSRLPYLACYQLQGDKMHKQWSVYCNEYFYGVRNDDVLFNKEKSFGTALDIEMDSQYIYVLYLDQLLSEYVYGDPERSYANKILVFDHKGNAVTELNLGCRIGQMALSSDKTKLYGIADLPEPVIVEFDLPKAMMKY